MASLICHSCRKSVNYDEPISRRSECSECVADLRCCFNCQFYDRNSHNECRETEASPVREKDKGNFCSYFRPVQKLGDKAEDAAREQLEQLFGKPAQQPESVPAENPKGSLKDEIEAFLKKR